MTKISRQQRLVMQNILEGLWPDHHLVGMSQFGGHHRVMASLYRRRWVEYDFVWASPPCQAFTAYKRRKGHVRPVANLIPQIRERLQGQRAPWVIENVPGAPLENPVMLCGSMFGLDVRRHRLFEASFGLAPPGCNHEAQAPRFPPATNRTNLRRTVEVGVYRIPLEVQRRAMGIDWMRLDELSNAIPPAYSEWIARQWLKQRQLLAG